MPAHAALTGADLHEPKGAASASADTVLVANGSGTTAWQKVTDDNIDATAVFNVNKFKLTCTFPDISANSSIYVPIPIAGTVTKVYGCLQSAITVGDAVLTFANNSDASMGTMTVAYSGSAAGDVDSLTPSTNNTFTAGQRMKITSNGGSTDTAIEIIVIEITQTA